MQVTTQEASRPATTTGMKITKLTENIGAEVTGIDLRQPVDADTQKFLYDALVEHIALVFRDQKFNPGEYLSAVSIFGTVMPDESPKNRLPELPLISQISSLSKDREGKRVMTGERWHSDHVNHQRPPKFTCLYAVKLPDSGGATNLANTREGYAALPDAVKKRVEGMKTANVIIGSASKSVNSDRRAWQAESPPDPVIHPLVRTHPDVGTKALYFHPNKVENIVGMEPQESQELLEELTEYMVKPEFLYAHQWRLGDMMIWDNRSAFHRASFDYDINQHRLLYRTLVEGDIPH
ncbi:MAG: TauD/TfdA family dioxygenase [Proteobacteria bacterium]|nr:TauD/TfdA family dioxygenase [Pseudomonadota bacterium]